ncbi:MAG: single-stranded DNA-binding protein [Phycisphaerae bacterium]|nr:single-stranded DNA-binding protein [Phycisphaerae bacterium]
MASFNKVILAGNLTRDPQLSYLPSNTPVCEFGMAINRKWKSQDGQIREEACFVDLRIYGRRAEVINQYLNKGSPLLVEGHLRFDQWEGKDGGKRSKLYVMVDNFEFMGGGAGGGRSGSRDVNRAAAPAQPAGGYEAPMAGGREDQAPGVRQDEMPPMDDSAPAGSDIPF